MEVITGSVSAMDDALRKVYDIIGGLPHYATLQPPLRVTDVCLMMMMTIII